MQKQTIFNKTPVQQNFLGLNAVYHGYAGLWDDAGRVYTPQQCDLEADRAAALGLKVARTYYKWYAYDFEKNCWDWHSPDFEAFCRWVARLQARGIDVALNAGWCSPGDVLSNSWGGKSPFTVAGDWQASVQNFAAFISESVHQLVQVRGLTNVKYLVLFTEPQNSNEGCPKGYNAYDAWYDEARAVADRLITDGRRELVKLIGPNEGSTVDPLMLHWVHEKDPNLLDAYSCHNYLDLSAMGGHKPYKGEISLAGAMRGMRAQQPVCLKPQTEYEMSAMLSLTCKDRLTVSGNAQFGVYVSQSLYFNAGGEPTDRLSCTSTLMVDAARINYEWTRFTFCFKTGNELPENTVAGVYGDIIQQGNILSVGELTLTEVATGRQLIAAPHFESTEPWTPPPLCCGIGGTTSYQMWRDWVKKARTYLNPGDELWYDEYNTNGKGYDEYDQPWHGTELAVARVAFMNGGLQSSFMWTLFDQQWPNNHTEQAWHRYVDGDHRFGVMPTLFRSTVPHPSYYAVQLTGYVGGGPGTKVYAGQEGEAVNVTMSEQPDGTVTVLAVNGSHESQPVAFYFEQPLNSVTLYRYLYNPATITPDADATPIGVSQTLEKVTAEITDELPAGAVVVYTSKKR